jgi:hypothetical protein
MTPIERSDSQFAIAYREELIAAAAPSISRHPDSDVLVRWARNKSELLEKLAFDFQLEADSAPIWLPRTFGGVWVVSGALAGFVTTSVD